MRDSDVNFNDSLDDKKSDELISLEKKIKEAREKSEGIIQKIGKLEGRIVAEEETLNKQKGFALSSEHKTVPLLEVENLVKEAEGSIEEAEKAGGLETFKAVLFSLRQMLRSFIENKKGHSNPVVLMRGPIVKMSEIFRRHIDAD